MLATSVAPILIRWSPVASRRTHVNDVPQHMDVVLLGHGTVHTSMESQPFVGMDE